MVSCRGLLRELLEFLGSSLSSVRQHVMLEKCSHIFFKIEILSLVSVCLWRHNLSTFQKPHRLVMRIYSMLFETSVMR